MENNFPCLSRRDFFKGLIALGIVATIPEAKSIPTLKERSKNIRYLAIWQPPGQRAKLSMFAGDVPPEAEVFVVGKFHILRFPTIHEALGAP